MDDSPLRDDRWQPTRGGLINLFKYEDQIFRYENGRLLLRGDNGSGKSRVLALQLPFLLDGEMSPYRVEPDRDSAKRMEWNLLMDRHERRTGYTWIEFGRLDEGTPRYLTLGCGMDARKGGGSPERWFFITPRRVGTDLHLLENRVPLGRRQLAAELDADGRGRLFERVGEYRAAVDDALFKLGARYAPLIDLLIQLRQPQLMRDMKEDVLSDALSEALPPVSEPLINEVAESFQGLDTDRQRTEDHREMLDSVETFREGYRQYLAVAVRRLCEVVRVGHSQFEQAARELRKIESEIEANAARLMEARREAETKRTDLARLEAEIATLRDSPEMRSKRDLDTALQRAEECEREAVAAESEWRRATQDLEAAKAEREKRGETGAARRESVSRAYRALSRDHEAVATTGAEFFDWRTAEIGRARSGLEALIASRNRSIVHLRECNAEIARHRHGFDLARERVDDQRSAVADADEKVRQSESRLRDGLEAFGRSVAAWEKSLIALDPTAFPRGADWAADLTAWIDEREGESPFACALAAGRERVRDELAQQRAEIARTAREVESEREGLRDELDLLERGRQPEPPPRHSRAPRTGDRPGAPFWRWFEFRDEIPEREHAGWEAALESSGLLDAWIVADGSREAILDHDDFLVIGEDAELEESNSLAAVLRPAAGGGPLTGLLRRIGNHPGAARCWMGRDGNWANGPHLGSWEKPAAEYLGHRARESARVRRIAELQSAIDGLERQLAALVQRVSELDGRAELLAAETRAAPRVEPVAALAIGLEADRESLQDSTARLAEAEARATAARETLERSLSARDADAADLDLAEWAEPPQLDQFADALDAFEKKAIAFWPAWDSALEAESELAAAERREAAAADREARLRNRFAADRDRAARARTEADTLVASVGATVEQLMARLHQAEADAKKTGAERTAIEDSIRKGEIEDARFTERHRAANEKRDSAEASRDHAVERMEVFVAERLFEEVDPAAQPDRATFSATAAVELARRLEQQLKDHRADDDRWHQMQSEIATTFNELCDHLGRHGLVPQLRSVDQSSVSVIDCEFQGQARTIRELSGILQGELRDRERVFEEREREVIENHLIGEAAVELQQRIRDGEEWVTNVNAELSQVTTSSGIQLKFAWEVSEANDERLKTVRRLFLKTSATWTLSERETIGAFLQERIRSAREEDDTVTWREHLRRALDYRAWHRFGILLRGGDDSSWKKLTKRTFGTGSGGEKAMTLTVPQFAAAAAHYKSADRHAPRLILLDEVFVGIDAPTRARLMGLLETFDLDYVMTSEREWGTHPTVSALAIYQLASRPGFNAVAVTRWVWNGNHKRRDDAAAEDSSTSVGLEANATPAAAGAELEELSTSPAARDG